MRIVYDGDSVELQDKTTGDIIACGQKYHGDVCIMDFKVVIPEAHVASVSFREVHNTLGHVNKAVLKNIVNQNAV